MKNSAVSRVVKHLCAIGTLSLSLVMGCAAEPNEATVDREIGLLAASPTTVSELGVVTWTVLEGEQGIRVIGRDADASTKVEVLVEPIATNLVQIDVLSPVAGSVRIHADGESEGATSEYLQRLTAALYADLGKQGTAGSEPIGEGAQALTHFMAGEIALVWSFFGYTANHIVGAPSCPAGRAELNLVHSGGGSCVNGGWVSQLDPADCQAKVVVSIVGWQTGTCYWQIKTY